MLRVKFILVFSFAIALTLLSPIYAATVPGTDFPFGRFTLKTPPMENPYPGFGNYYSAVPLGVESVLWNPASLTNIKYVQSSLSLINQLAPSEYTRKYETTDGEEKIGDLEEFKFGYYLTGDQNVTAPATREHTAHAFSQVQSTGMKFKQAFRVNDRVVLGILSQPETGLSIDMSGNFPSLAKTKVNFLGSNSLGSGLSIDQNGYLTYTHTQEGGSTYQYKTSEKLWSGFLDQNSNIPLNIILEARDDVSVSPGATLAGAYQWENVSIGASFTPVSATANINNIARAVINDGTPDIIFYQPDFNISNESSALDWVQDPNRYSSESGYKRNTISVPAGESIAEARYQGFYQASALRGDLGVNVDFYGNAVLGIVLENFGGASLNFRGTGRVAYANSRVSTAEPSGFIPGQDLNWDLFTDEFKPAENSEKLYLEEQVNMDIPKKLKIGFAFKKPFMVALDYEMNQTPIKYKQVDSNNQEKIVTISNINILRVGIETQIFTLPVWIRGGSPLLFKPEVTNVDQPTQDNLNKYFKYGVLPVGLDLGLEMNLYGTRLGADLGVSALSVISLYQLDTLNPDTGKVAYWDMFFKHNQWKTTYLAAIDPSASAAAYSNRTNKNDAFGMEHLKWIQTLTVSYLF